MNIEDKGSYAFPDEYGGCGMTLRDYFAGQVMPSIMASALVDRDNPSDVATLSYRMADLMIEARK